MIRERNQRIQEENEKQILKQNRKTKAKKAIGITTVIIAGIAIVFAVIVLYKKVYIPSKLYESGERALQAGDYETAMDCFMKLSGYKDSGNKIQEVDNKIKMNIYQSAIDMKAAGKIEDAKELFETIVGYGDVENQIVECEGLIKAEIVKEQ